MVLICAESKQTDETWTVFGPQRARPHYSVLLCSQLYSIPMHCTKRLCMFELGFLLFATLNPNMSVPASPSGMRSLSVDGAKLGRQIFSRLLTLSLPTHWTKWPRGSSYKSCSYLFLKDIDHIDIAILHRHWSHVEHEKSKGGSSGSFLLIRAHDNARMPDQKVDRQLLVNYTDELSSNSNVTAQKLLVLVILNRRKDQFCPFAAGTINKLRVV